MAAIWSRRRGVKDDTVVSAETPQLIVRRGNISECKDATLESGTCYSISEIWRSHGANCCHTWRNGLWFIFPIRWWYTGKLYIFSQSSQKTNVCWPLHFLPPEKWMSWPPLREVYKFNTWIPLFLLVHLVHQVHQPAGLFASLSELAIWVARHL